MVLNSRQESLPPLDLLPLTCYASLPSFLSPEPSKHQSSRMQKSRLLSPVGLLALGLSLLVAPILGHQDPQQPDSYSSSPNTQPAPPTSDKPKAAPSDRAIAQKIRRAIYADKTLSTVARQIKVVVQNGKVTLLGSVRSGEERNTILAKAAAVAGEGDVVNKIEIPKS
jgi:hypothetical protein